MEKFRRRPGEEILLKGTIDYLRGEQTFKAIMFKGAVKECKAYLTTERFVACEESKLKMFGFLLLLISYFVAKKIVFEIPLDTLASIGIPQEKGSQELFLKRSDGAEFRIRLNSLFNVREKWVDTFSDAVMKNRPGIEVLKSETGIEFVRREADA